MRVAGFETQEAACGGLGKTLLQKAEADNPSLKDECSEYDSSGMNSYTRIESRKFGGQRFLIGAGGESAKGYAIVLATSPMLRTSS